VFSDVEVSSYQKKKILQKHRCNDPQREKKKERELGLLLPLPCNVTGARRFVHWDGAKSSESDMSNHAVGLLDLHGGCVGGGGRGPPPPPRANIVFFTIFMHSLIMLLPLKVNKHLTMI